MLSRLCFIAIFCLTGCGVRQEAVDLRRTASLRQAVERMRHDSLAVRQSVLRDDSLTIRWEEWVYARPDSTGHQAVERIIRGEAGALRREATTGCLVRQTTDTLARHLTADSKEDLTARRQTDTRPAGWFPTAALALAAGLFIGFFASRNK